jgi:hypothetical protein
VPDVAYHINKFERGFTKVINVQGTDHHGTIARVRAGLQAAGVGIPQGYPDYVLHKMVTVMKGGQEVKISKRAGSYVTLRDLIDWTSRDAVRFFLISRKADTEFVFDVDLALKASDENPVFYVQYAHARICSVLAQYVAQGGAGAAALAGRPALLTAPTEQALMLKLADYPEMLTRAAPTWRRTTWPSTCATWPAPCTAGTRPSASWSTTPALARARMALLAATRQVLRNALAVLGVSAPERWPANAAEARHDEAGAGRRQRGGFVLGLVVGLLIGLALALGVALYITKAPVPFVNKVPQRTAEQDQAEPSATRTGTRTPRWPASPGAGQPAAAADRAPAGGGPAARLPPRPRAGRRRAGPRDPAAILAGGGAPSAPPSTPAGPTRSSTSCRPAPTRGRRRRTAARQAGHAWGSRPRSPNASSPAARSTACAGPVRDTQGRGRRLQASCRRRHRGAAGARRATLSQAR